VAQDGGAVGQDRVPGEGEDGARLAGEDGVRQAVYLALSSAALLVG
jgi:hypothetical protein